MITVQEIEKAIQQLPLEGVFRLREVIQNRLEEKCGRQFADDAEAGLLDESAAVALEEQKCLSHPSDNLCNFAALRENATSSLHSVEELSAIVVDCAYKLHVEAGPGLLETVYEVVLAKMLKGRGLRVRRQVKVPIELLGLKFDEGFRADLIVEDSFLIELKSVENLLPVHSKQVLTYLRLLQMPLGLLINFGAGTFKEGVRRIVNQHDDASDSKLRININPI
jgi:GxxExxY protein